MTSFGDAVDTLRSMFYLGGDGLYS